jgi:hypothetical protein
VQPTALPAIEMDDQNPGGLVLLDRRGQLDHVEEGRDCAYRSSVITRIGTA